MNDLERKQEIKKLIDICHINLNNSKKCMDYLKKERGLSDLIISKYKIGYFPQNISKLTQFISRLVLEDLNILNYSGNSKFVDFYYLVFPIYNEYGDPIGINGRTLLSEGEREVIGISKYENSSFKKSQILFGFDKARSSILKKNNVFISEGNFDVIKLHQNGITNSVAICGTSFSKEHFLKLLRYTNTFTFILDNDDAGRIAISRIYKKYSNKGANIRFLSFPSKYKDIDEFFQDNNTKKDFYQKFKQYNPETINMEWT